MTTGTSPTRRATTTVSIVEDHPVYQQGLRMVLDSDPGLAVGVVAESVEAFRDAAVPPDGVVLLDLALPGLSGVEAVEALTGDGHRVLMVSASERSDDLARTLDAGAWGYVSKSADAEQVLWAVHRVAEGSFYVPPHLAAALLEHRRRARPTAAVRSLTSREREVLAEVAAGLTDQEVADQLGISIRTVGSHLDNVREKTGRRRRADLTRLAVDEGLVPES